MGLLAGLVRMGEDSEDEAECWEPMQECPGGFITVRLGSEYKVGLCFRNPGGRMNRTINQPLAAEPLKSGCCDLSL